MTRCEDIDYSEDITCVISVHGLQMFWGKKKDGKRVRIPDGCVRNPQPCTYSKKVKESYSDESIKLAERIHKDQLDREHVTIEKAQNLMKEIHQKAENSAMYHLLMKQYKKQYEKKIQDYKDLFKITLNDYRNAADQLTEEDVNEYRLNRDIFVKTTDKLNQEIKNLDESIRKINEPRQLVNKRTGGDIHTQKQFKTIVDQIEQFKQTQTVKEFNTNFDNFKKNIDLYFQNQEYSTPKDWIILLKPFSLKIGSYANQINKLKQLCEVAKNDKINKAFNELGHNLDIFEFEFLTQIAENLDKISQPTN